MTPEEYDARAAQRHADEARRAARTLRASGAVPPADVLARLLDSLAHYAEEEARRGA